MLASSAPTIRTPARLRSQPRVRGAGSRQGACRTRSSLQTSGELDSSERDLSLVLKRRWDVLLRPAVYNVTHTVALKHFVDTCILAYSTGYSEEFIKNQALAQMSEDNEEGTSQKLQDEVDLLGTACSLVFITIQSCPTEPIQRWSTAAPVSALTGDNWRGFVGLIANAYFKDNMAWYPINRLMMVQSATLGYAERPEEVAERMAVVYQTLNTVSPRFPSRFES